MSIQVKTFSDTKIAELIKNADPTLRAYIKSLKEALDRWYEINTQALNKIKELAEENNKLSKRAMKETEHKIECECGYNGLTEIEKHTGMEICQGCGAFDTFDRPWED